MWQSWRFLWNLIFRKVFKLVVWLVCDLNDSPCLMWFFHLFWICKLKSTFSLNSNRKTCSKYLSLSNKIERQCIFTRSLLYIRSAVLKWISLLFTLPVQWLTLQSSQCLTNKIKVESMLQKHTGKNCYFVYICRSVWGQCVSPRRDWELLKLLADSGLLWNLLNR